MRTNKTSSVGCIVLVVCSQMAVMAQQPAPAQPEAKAKADADTTIIRPGGELRGAMGTTETRDALVQNV